MADTPVPDPTLPQDDGDRTGEFRPGPDPTNREQRLDDLVVSYLEAVERGERQDPGPGPPATRSWPTELMEFVVDQDQFQRWSQPLRYVAGVAVDGRRRHGRGRGPKPKPEIGRRKSPGWATMSSSEEIARGGMGVVYRARQVSLQPHRRPQDDPGRALVLAGGVAGLSPGGGSGRAARPSEHRPHLRGRRARRPALLQHEADRRGRPPRARCDQSDRDPQGHDPLAGDRRPGGASRPPARHPPPRLEAGQHPARSPGRAARHRLRSGQSGSTATARRAWRGGSWAHPSTWHRSRPRARKG